DGNAGSRRPASGVVTREPLAAQHLHGEAQATFGAVTVSGGTVTLGAVGRRAIYGAGVPRAPGATGGVHRRPLRWSPGGPTCARAVPPPGAGGRPPSPTDASRHPAPPLRPPSPRRARIS